VIDLRVGRPVIDTTSTTIKTDIPPVCWACLTAPAREETRTLILLIRHESSKLKTRPLAHTSSWQNNSLPFLCMRLTVIRASLNTTRGHLPDVTHAGANLRGERGLAYHRGMPRIVKARTSAQAKKQWEPRDPGCLREQRESQLTNAALRIQRTMCRYNLGTWLRLWNSCRIV